MKRSTLLAQAATATLGIGAVSVPVFAQQSQMQSGGMGMIGGAQSYAMANFDTNTDGTLSPRK